MDNSRLLEHVVEEEDCSGSGLSSSTNLVVAFSIAASIERIVSKRQKQQATSAEHQQSIVVFFLKDDCMPSGKNNNLPGPVSL
jgi:hypothetical protein